MQGAFALACERCGSSLANSDTIGMKVVPCTQPNLRATNYELNQIALWIVTLLLRLY
jgi:hypothetical protein